MYSIFHTVFGKISKKVPTNYTVLGIFTMAEAYSVSLVCSMYTADSVLLSVAATLAATIGLTHYAATTDQDLTELRGAGKGI